MAADACCAVGRGEEGDHAPFDLAVIGWGSAGFSAAITAAQAGARVALIGCGTIGGTCVNVGCVPSKAMIRAAEAFHAARAARRFAGMTLEAHLDDWSALIAQKDALVASLRRRKYVDLLADYPTITPIEGRARLIEDGRIRVSGHEVPIRARRIVIATGSRPAVPAIPGLETVEALDSTAALALARLPRSMVVIGAGFVALELAQMFARFGVRVSLLARHGLLSHLDPEIGAALAMILRDEGLEIFTDTDVDRIACAGGGARVSFTRRTTGEVCEVTAERLLLATGRRANTDDLGLEALGIETDLHGRIRVDEFMRTSHPGIFAAGDCSDREAFVYTAAHGAKVAARNALEGPRHRYDALGLPEVVFTDPQVAVAGIGERTAHARGLAVRAVRLDLDQLPRALADHRSAGFIKLVAEEPSGRLLGAQMLAPEAGDAIQTASLAIRQRLDIDALGDMLFPYLTTVEGLKLTAQGFRQDVTRLSCCAG